jgi:hypothetical protein
MWATDPVRSLLRSAASLRCSVAYFHHIPPSLRRGVLRCCLSRFFTPSMAFAFADTFRRLSLLPFRANISTLQGSLYVTGCGFALLSQEDATLYHPGTRAAPPVTQKHSRQRPATRRPDPHRDRTASGDRLPDDSLSGHTSDWLGGFECTSVVPDSYCMVAWNSRAGQPRKDSRKFQA